MVDVDWVMQYLDDPSLQLVDARPLFSGGHIPGALPLSAMQLATTVEGVMLQIRPASEAEPILQTAGLRAGTTVVVYGEPPEYDPARVVWALHYYMHGDVRYLDGGWPAWLDGGGPVDDGSPTGTPTDYAIAGADDAIRVTGDWILQQLGDPPYDSVDIGLVDARSHDEWDNGTIPSAIHVEWTNTLGPDGLFLPENELAALYAPLDAAGINVTYCLVGWRASVAWLSLRHLGFDDARMYDGSWAEWGAGGFPIEP